MNDEIGKDIMDIKKELAAIKEEIIGLNSLINDKVEEFKIDFNKKIKEKDSKEIEDIIKKCLNNF